MSFRAARQSAKPCPVGVQHHTRRERSSEHATHRVEAFSVHVAQELQRDVVATRVHEARLLGAAGAPDWFDGRFECEFDVFVQVQGNEAAMHGLPYTGPRSIASL